MPSFYETIKKLIPKDELDHHESDLYVRDSELARTIIRQFGKTDGTTFISRVDGKKWHDLPFAYEPFWNKKRKAAKKG